MSVRIAVILAFALVLWGNIAAVSLGSSAWLPGGSWSFVVAGILLVAASLAVARSLALAADDVGLAGDPLRGSVIGFLVGATAAGIGVVFLRAIAPPLAGRAIEYAPLATATGPDLARHIAFFLPLGDILPEEIAFRGVLLGALRRALDARRAIVASAAAFGLWHLSVVSVTVNDTTLGWPSLWFGPAIVGALGVVFVGGLVLAWLRFRARSLATTVLAHWSFNAVVLVGLWATQPASPSGCC